MTQEVTVETPVGRNWAETIDQTKGQLAASVNLKDYKIALVPGSVKWDSDHLIVTYKILGRRIG